MQVFIDITRYVKQKFWDLLILLLRECLNIRQIYLFYDAQKLKKLRKTLIVQKQQGLLKIRQRRVSQKPRVEQTHRKWNEMLEQTQRKWAEMLDRWVINMDLKQPNQQEMLKVLYLQDMYLQYQQQQVALLQLQRKWREYRYGLELWEIQEYHIKGWVTKVLPEEWCGEIEALRRRWYDQHKGEFWIEIMTSFHLHAMFKAYLQIKVENIWLSKKRQG